MYYIGKAKPPQLISFLLFEKSTLRSDYTFSH